MGRRDRAAAGLPAPAVAPEEPAPRISGGDAGLAAPRRARPAPPAVPVHLRGAAVGLFLYAGGRLPGGVFRPVPAAGADRQEQGAGRHAPADPLLAEHGDGAARRAARAGRAQASLHRPRRYLTPHAARPFLTKERP